MSIFKRLFSSSRRVSSSAPKWPQDQIMAFYLFNSRMIEESIQVLRGGYGEYAQRSVLAVLHEAVQPLGGWKALSYLLACHGDLFERDLFGKPTGTAVLADWIRLKSLDALAVKWRLEADFGEQLRGDFTKIGFVPYAVGLWPISDTIAFSAHSKLLEAKGTGYIGNLSVEPHSGLPFVAARLPAMKEAGLTGEEATFSAMASILSLPIKMGIRTDGESFGWLMSEEELAKVGLSKLETD